MRPETRLKLDKFHLRPYQQPLWDAVLEKGYKKSLVVMPRRAGKDITAWNIMIRAAIKTVGIYFYCLPTFRQARLVIWDSITNSGERFLDYIPKELIEKINSQEMKITLVNGSIIQLIGSDTYDTSLVGTNPRMIVFSEYALADSRAYTLAARPILNANEGTVIIVSTPRGKNSLWELYNIAQNSPEWFCQKLTLDDTQHVSKHDIEKEIASGEISRDLVEQEYYCFPAGQVVLTPDSMKPIEDIKVGDLVISHRGRPRQVLETYKREYSGELIEIESYGSSESLRCTPNHPVRIYDRTNQQYSWKKAEDLKVSDHVVFPKMAVVENFFSPSPLDRELALLIAWYITEGSSTRNSVQFALGTKKEASYVSELIRACHFEPHIIKTKTAHQVHIYSCSLADFFKINCGFHSSNKRIPFSLISGWEEIFFEELMKGDGCYSISRGYEKYTYSTISKTLAYQVQLLANSLEDKYVAGISVCAARKSKIEGREVNCSTSYQVNIGKPPRRGGILKRAKNCVAAPIKNIVRAPFEGEVYNFKVQYDESYLVNGRAVHNCSFTVGHEGSYYAKYIDKMRLNGQIGIVPWEASFKVHTAWDLGVRDSTSIIFFQTIGQTVRIIDCYEKNKEGLEHYVKVLEGKPYSYGKHIFPHDVRVMELGSGITRIEKLRQLGVRPTIADDHEVMDGIESVRSAFSKVWIDEKNAATLIKALENYRQEYDSKRNIYKLTPLHDQFSHMADAMRYLAVSLPKTRDGMSAEDLDKLYRETVYGTEDKLPPIFQDNRYRT